MTREYFVLQHHALAPGARVGTPLPPARLTPESPALEAMTDLQRIEAATIAPHRSIVECNTVMIVHSIRLLFVEDADRSVVGVITATDLLGEKPVRFMRERGVRHHEILVSDLMTPASALEALDLQSVTTAQVGHIVATLKSVGRQHTFVTDEGGKRICGLFSATDIARRLGAEVPTHEVAASFAQIEAALSR
ncbi:MAG TPA: CBS domain-containing protein [Usitatibacteraceae bacterium]|nr:CBS domain-containing protein [Usitatibacteraceae bacterium]